MANGLPDAIDAVVEPSIDEVLAAALTALGYSGNGRWSADWYARAVGLGIVHGSFFEANPTYSQGGEPAGLQAVSFQEARMKPYLPDGTNIYVVSDGNSADAWDCGPFARGIAQLATMPFFCYGSVACCDSFLAAVRGHPLLVDGTMIPETWGQASLIVQTVGRQAPISTPHDFDIVVAPYWRGATPPPPQLTEDSMLIRRTEVDPAVPDQPVGHTELVSAWGYDWEPSYDALPGATPVSNAVWNSVHARIDDAVAKLKAASTGGAEPVPCPDCPPFDITAVSDADFVAENARRLAE